MFTTLRIPRDQFVVKEVDLQNKSQEFLELNPGENLQGGVNQLVFHWYSTGFPLYESFQY